MQEQKTTDVVDIPIELQNKLNLAFAKCDITNEQLQVGWKEKLLPWEWQIQHAIWKILINNNFDVFDLSGNTMSADMSDVVVLFHAGISSYISGGEETEGEKKEHLKNLFCQTICKGIVDVTKKQDNLEIQTPLSVLLYLLDTVCQKGIFNPYLFSVYALKMGTTIEDVLDAYLEE